MMRNMAGMMKKVQEMQSRMEALQQEMADTEFSAAVGGGAVQVTMTGKGELTALKIDPSLVKEEDVEILEDLILAAHQDAKTKAEALLQEKTQEMMGGLGLPPGFKMPF